MRHEKRASSSSVAKACDACEQLPQRIHGEDALVFGLARYAIGIRPGPRNPHRGPVVQPHHELRPPVPQQFEDLSLERMIAACQLDGGLRATEEVLSL